MMDRSLRPLVVLKQARVCFDSTVALHGVDLALSRAPIAIVGPSGAGKTTLLRLMGDQVQPSAGTVEREVERNRIGFIYQDHQLVPNYRVVQNVLTGRVGQQGLIASIKSVLWPSAEREQAVHALLSRVGVADKLFSWTSQLSVGERQRVAIARALYLQPEMLLADEPVASVDPVQARELLTLLLSLAREEHWGLAVSLHNIDLARALFERVIGLRDGRVVFDTEAAAVTDAQVQALYAPSEGTQK
jgi:phosphonate transport system ATP-binding protein